MSLFLEGFLAIENVFEAFTQALIERNMPVHGYFDLIHGILRYLFTIKSKAIKLIYQLESPS